MAEQALEAFHFLRPGWLLLVPIALWLHWRLKRIVSAADQWRGIIDQNLLDVLLVAGSGSRRFRPYQLLTAVTLLASLALAGPAWKRELTPFTEDRAPLVIALELTAGMTAIDQPPSRLARAKQKIRDILALRQGARTAVIGYAGSAHAVLPLTDDTALTELYLASLSPEIMPQAGDRPDQALELAGRLLAEEASHGTIIFLSDGIDRSYAQRFGTVFATSQDQLLMLAIGTPAGGPLADGSGNAPPVDLAGMKAAAEAAGGWVTSISVDESDVTALDRRVRRHLVNAIEADEKLRWHDAGYTLVWPLALLILAWFRRGWTVQWQ